MCRVLIVDNDILVQKALKKIIETNKGFSVVEAVSSGEEAIDYCKALSPNIIFMDIMLPGMNGLEMVKSIRENETEKSGEKSDICIISAYQSIEFVKEAMKLDIKEYLTKPISKQAIEEILKEYKPSVTDYQDILVQIQEIVDAKDFRMVYDRPKEIAGEILEVLEGNKTAIAECMYSIARFLQSNYLGITFEQSQLIAQFPINENLIDDKIVIEMWLCKVLDFVYKHRFVERYASAKPVLDYIDEHIKEYISMLSIIDNCHISQQYILRLFKEQMKMSTLDYIQSRKIMLAKWYFYLGDYSTLDVAVMLGYGDAGYFSKIFKKYESMTAYQYKSNLENAR